MRATSQLIKSTTRHPPASQGPHESRSEEHASDKAFCAPRSTERQFPTTRQGLDTCPARSSRGTTRPAEPQGTTRPADPPTADRVGREGRAAVSRSGAGPRRLGRGLDTCPARTSRGTTRPPEPHAAADRVADEERGGVSRSGDSPRRLGRGLDTCPARSSRGPTRPAEPQGTTRPADPPTADRVADEERGGVSRSGDSPRRLGRGLDTCPARTSRGTTRPAEPQGTTRPAEPQGTTRPAGPRSTTRPAGLRSTTRPASGSDRPSGKGPAGCRKGAVSRSRPGPGEVSRGCGSRRGAFPSGCPVRRRCGPRRPARP